MTIIERTRPHQEQPCCSGVGVRSNASCRRPSSSSSSNVYVPSPRQLRWLRRMKQHMAIPHGRQIWIWFDILSIPQRERDLQIKAIASLPAYTQLCTRQPMRAMAPGCDLASRSNDSRKF